MKKQFLPVTLQEANNRGWEKLDVILVTGDAYVDHPSFGVAVMGRYLESMGVRVGIIAMPDVTKESDFTALGKPEWFFGVTSGNLDSMIMKTTAQRKKRSDDAYVPGGLSGLRPKRAVIAYCNKLREVFNKPEIIIGGLEASLRRFAHYDYWDDKVRRSILLDTRADLLVYGMAEKQLKEIVEAKKKGKSLSDLRIKGSCVILNREERIELGDKAQTIPSCEEVQASKEKYARASKIIHTNQNPYCAKTLIQKHGNRYLCVFPPVLPMEESELDAVYGLPFIRKPHYRYKEKISAFEMIKHSVTAMRGCFGGCSFCALTVHQGRAIQSRSAESIVKEVKQVTKMEDFTGYISDIGGPTANMYKLVCSKPEVEARCKKISCIHPKICPILTINHAPQLEMLKKARSVQGVKKVFISSGIRYDLANKSPEYMRELVKNHVSGQLKVAPEHVNEDVLMIMRKPNIEEFTKFKEMFEKETKKAGLEQYLVQYFISAHPGCGLDQQIELAIYLKKNNLRLRQVQDFIPAPMTLAADIYYTEMDPISGEKVPVTKDEKERKQQRALMQYYKPENAEDVRDALKKADRTDLIGYGTTQLVPYNKNFSKRHRKK
ncbi:MAG: YgiQ family radical SAM protein [Nitrospinae bacterium]|nr:YgiQ family radical SAM protein [Nitrospinota bacterium]